MIEADYVWPYHLHASIGPSCAVAEVSASQIQVWTGSQNPHDVRKDIATLTGMAADQINVTRLEASGCYGRNCADDVASDAVLLSQAVGRPVRVQLMREQEAAWEPKGTGQLIRVRGGLDENHAVLGYELKTCYPSNDAAALALILTGKVPNKPRCCRWATVRPSRSTSTPRCAWSRRMRRPSCARRGCAASRPCPTSLPMSAGSTNAPTWPAKTRWPTACAT